MTTTPAPARWAVVAAYTVPVCVLPSAIWRVTPAETTVGWYLVFLSVFSMALALLTLGLVHRWGEHLPRRLGGRPLPAHAVARAALTGGGMLVAVCVYFFVNQAFDLVGPSQGQSQGQGWGPAGLRDGVVHEPPGWEVLRYYLPLVAWGPLLIAVALDYRRRMVTPRSRRRR